MGTSFSGRTERDFESMLFKPIENSDRDCDEVTEAWNRHQRYVDAKVAEIANRTLREIEAGKANAGKLFRFCEDCDEPIPQKRLEAVPWATRCRECQEKEEGAI